MFVTRRIPEAGIARLRDGGALVEVWDGDPDSGPSHAEVVAGASRCDVLLSLLTETVDAQVLAASPELRGVSNYAVGYDNVDVVEATRLGIPVTNTPDVLTETTADLTWALLLATARNVVAGDAYLRAGRYRIWGPELLLGQDVSPGGDGRRRTLGIVGFGRIGTAVARRAVGFDMEVLAYGPRSRKEIENSGLARWAEMDVLLERSDFVSLHAPLRPETRHMIGATQLRRMKRTAYLINTARGPLVDEAALVAALRDGQIAGAGLDVYEDEPRLTPGLVELDNVTLLPHLGSATRGTRDRMATMAADNALAMLAGRRPEHCVNPEVY